jgi:hypothetical protein
LGRIFRGPQARFSPLHERSGPTIERPPLMRVFLPSLLIAVVVVLAIEAAFVANLEVRRVLASLSSRAD